MKIYLSGPMSNLPDHNIPTFNRYARLLREAGFKVVSPPELGDGSTMTWQQYLRIDIKALCDCDTLACLPGWEHSDGAQLEIHLAHRLGLRIVSVESLWEVRVQ